MSQINLDRSSEAFEKLPVPKALAKFIIPSVITQIIMLILNLTDAFFVGQTEDPYQISAMTITFPVVMMIGCVATIFSAGANANIAASLASKDEHRARSFSAFALYTTVALVGLMIVILNLCERPLLDLLGADQNSLEHCHGYIFWVFCVGGIPLAVSQVMSQMFIAEGKTRIASLGLSGAGIINAVLDPVFIFGLDMGVAGAGFATCVSNYCSCLFFLLFYIKKRKSLVISLDPRNYTAKGGIAVRTISVGLPAGLNMLLLNFTDFLRNSLLGSYGSQLDLASWGVVQKLGIAAIQICLGIAHGIRPLVSYNFTLRVMKRTKDIIRGAFLIMGVYTVGCALCFLFLGDVLVGLFLPIPEAATIAERLLSFWGISIIAGGFLELLNSIFQAIGHWKLSTIAIAIGKITYMVVVVLVARPFGTNGIVLSQPVVDLTLMAIMMICCLRIINRENDALSQA